MQDERRDGALNAVGVDPDTVGITLDVGYASANNTDWREIKQHVGTATATACSDIVTPEGYHSGRLPI